MTPEIGHLALALALALGLALVQSVLPLLGANRGNQLWMQSAYTTSIAQLTFVGIAFAALMRSFTTSDFTVLNVATNSHSLKPMLFKIAGTWGSHVGSLLLWVLILAIFGAGVAVFGSNIPEALKARTLAVQAWISTGFLSFMLLTSNPFDRVFPLPLDGNDLNPLRQDVGLALHPPFLYLGYVGFSIVFSFAVAALLEGRVDAAWARWVRPWTLAALMCLTAGIVLGSWWAYYELGMGGAGSELLCRPWHVGRSAGRQARERPVSGAAFLPNCAEFHDGKRDPVHTCGRSLRLDCGPCL